MARANSIILFSLFNCCLICLSISAFSQERSIEDYIQTANSNSPLLKDLNNQLLLNKLDSALILSNYKPHIGFNSTGTYAPVIHGFGYDEALSNGHTFNALVTVNQSLLGKSRINNQVQGLNLGTDSVSNLAKISQQDIRRNVITQYIAAYASQLQNSFDAQVNHLLKEEEIILKKLTQQSVYKQSDYLAFLVVLKQQELQMSQNRIAHLNNIAALNYSSGIRSTDSVRLAEPKLDISIASALNQSIFAKQYQIDSLRILNNRQAIDLNYRPQVGVYADGGYNSSFIDQPYKNFGTSFGFTVAVPIYDGHQRKLQYSKLAIQEQTRIGYRDYFFGQYNQQIAQLRQQLQQSESLFSKINEQIKFTESLIHVDGKLLQTGDITVADYILAIKNYLDSQNVLRQTNITRLELINQLNYWNH